jgi:ABC-type antimicrobial peptide transport system permease subunit
MPTVSLGELSAIAERSRSQAAFRMWLMTGFAAAAICLAAIGVYGVASYRVRQRTREIGIRLALGAVASDVIHEILVESLRYSLAGVAVGAGFAAMATRVLAALVFGIAPRDPITFVLTCVGMAAVATLAAFVPARRAASLNPIVALRCD